MTLRTMFIILIGLMFSVTAAQAADVRVKDLTVSGVWARASAGPARAGAAYLTIANHGKAMDRLVAVSTPAAKRADIHTTLMEKGVMKMRPVKAVEVHPGEPAVLRPGGMHIMLMGLKAPLEEGKHFPLTLTFERAGSVEVMVMVEAAGSMGDMRPHKAPMEHRQGS
jgi:copper(I)-binding protein